MTTARKRTEYLPWGEMVEQAVRAKGKWVLPNHLIGVSPDMARHVTAKRNPALHREDGSIQADKVGQFKTDEGRIICDVWIRFVPKEASNDEQDA